MNTLTPLIEAGLVENAAHKRVGVISSPHHDHHPLRHLLAVAIELPVCRAPAFEEAVEVCPCGGIEGAPLGDKFGGVDGRLMMCEGFG